MPDSTMQDFPLTIQHILGRMRTVSRESEVATLTDDGVTRATYGEVVERVDRLCAAMASLGVERRERVATFSWNTQQHLELYLAAPCMGAVLHTLNIRLFPEQLTYIVNHADDKLIFVDESLVPVLEKLAPTFDAVERFVVIGEGDAGTPPAPLRYDQLLAAQAPEFDYPELDQRQEARPSPPRGNTGN